MSDPQQFAERFAMTFDPEAHRRRICGKEVIIHCHHYNARLQRTVERADAIDGKAIFVSSAEAVFGEQLRCAFRDGEDEATRWRVAQQLYAHLGYGTFDVSRLDDGIITAPHSHFVEGWRAGFGGTTDPVCSLADGFLQAAIAAITGDVVTVREEACRLQTGEACRFRIDRSRTTPLAKFELSSVPVETSLGALVGQRSATVDEQAIIDAVVQMPIHGAEDGLIPAFNVYLANTPADFYNLVSVRFIEAMSDADLGSIGRAQLVGVAETCAMNTFRGIKNSAEWDALIAPMVRIPEDELFGLVAVSNALGWGNWRILEHTAEESLTLVSSNGYEASGYVGMRGQSGSPQCLMLTGVSSGVMELLYGEGPFEARFGQFITDERSCRCCGETRCEFEVEAA